jgi:hypothetical protein
VYLISESGEPLSCYNTENGKLKWRQPLNIDGHYLRLGYSKLLDKFIGISWPFLKGGNKKLKYLNLQDGNVEKELVIHCPAEAEFALEGDLLITSEKEIINISTGIINNW